MKRTVYAILLLVSFVISGCGSSGNKPSGDNQIFDPKATVNIIYFHGKHRCTTCDAIREMAQQYMTENFTNGEAVNLAILDYTDPLNREMADKYRVAYTTLIVAGRDDFSNLTELAFSQILRNPDRVKAELNAEVNRFLEQ